MKRIGNLYSKICEKNNIQKAINKAALRKKNRENVKKILDNQIYYTELLHKILKNKDVGTLSSKRLASNGPSKFFTSA